MRKMYFLAGAQIVFLSAFLVSGNKIAVASLVLSSTVTLGIMMYRTAQPLSSGDHHA